MVNFDRFWHYYRLLLKSLNEEPIIYAFIIFSFSSLYLFGKSIEIFYGELVILFFIYIPLLTIFLILASFPAIIIGLFVQKKDVFKVGIGFVFAFITLIIYLQLTNKIFYRLDWTLPFILILFSDGIVATGIGSYLGNSVRRLTKKQNFTINSKIAFVLIYFSTLLLLFMFQYIVLK